MTLFKALQALISQSLDILRLCVAELDRIPKMANVKQPLSRTNRRSRMGRKLNKQVTSLVLQALQGGFRPILFSFTSWRSGLVTCALISLIILCINSVFVVWTLKNWEVFGGKALIYEGSCSSVNSRMNGAQVLATFIGSLLLGASSYCMQILSAPTRDEIDHAHAEGEWLDVGVHSVRNLYHLSGRRKILWIGLGASSVCLFPLSVSHSGEGSRLTISRYNTILFSSIVSNDYNVISVTPEFLTGAPWHLYGFLPHWSDRSPNHFPDLISKIQRNAGSYEHLETDDCVSAYDKPYITDRKHVLLVSENDTVQTRQWRWNDFFNPRPPVLAPITGLPRGSILAIDLTAAPGPKSQYNPHPWLCDFPESFPLCFARIGVGSQKEMRLHGRIITHCLSEKVQETCNLEVNLDILAIISLIIFGKTIIIIFILLTIPGTPLLTLGDAITSFLANEDYSTKSSCVRSRSDIKRNLHVVRDPIPWKPKDQFWYQAVSHRQWLAFISL